MKLMSRIAGVLVLAASLAACEPIDDDGGGGGGGGNVLFTRGFAFVRGDDRNIYVVDDQGDANSPKRLTASGGASHPSVSRNGRTIVFVQQTGTTNFELRTVPTDGSAQPSTVLASGAGCSGCTNFRYPTFNTAGTVIVFAFNRGSGNFSLGRVNADGSGFQALTNNPGLSYGAPSFFPNEDSVLVPAGNNSAALTLLERVTLTGGSSPVANNLGQEILNVLNRAAVSPDGRRVALDGRLRDGSSRIFVAPLSPFSTPVRVTDHSGQDTGAQDTFPSWINADQVGFLSDAGGGQSIYRINVSGTPGPGTLLIPTAGEPSYGGQ